MVCLFLLLGQPMATHHPRWAAIKSGCGCCQSCHNLFLLLHLHLGKWENGNEHTFYCHFMRVTAVLAEHRSTLSSWVLEEVVKSWPISSTLACSTYWFQPSGDLGTCNRITSFSLAMNDDKNSVWWCVLMWEKQCKTLAISYSNWTRVKSLAS